jgi:hypothetical protein
MSASVGVANPLAPTYLSLAGQSEGLDLPPDGSDWEQIEPGYGAMRSQLWFLDDGDLHVSVGDQITLEVLGLGHITDPPTGRRHRDMGAGWQSRIAKK